MTVNDISTCIVTDKIEESRDFYIRHFGAKVTFDCGWYVNLSLGKGTSTLQFMSPQQGGQEKCDGRGITCNLSVDDVDREYERLTAEGLEAVMPLEDHPWGDRGFAVQGPNGIVLYIYSDREPGEDFRKYFKK